MFNFRTAAIIVQNGKLLVTKDDSTEHYYLPGGRVTMREKAEDALTRELKEELGVTVAPERAVWIAQSSSPRQAKSSVTTSFVPTSP